MRNLTAVIDEILSLDNTAPARKGLESLKTSVMYTAPEWRPGDGVEWFLLLRL